MSGAVPAASRLSHPDQLSHPDKRASASGASEQSHRDDRRWVRGELGAARITKVGLWLALITLVLSVAAANTGNNSLYLVVAGCCSLLLIAWWSSRANIRGHEFSVQVPDEVYAGSPVRIDYSLRRRSKGNSVDLLLLIDGSRSGSLVRRLAGRRWPVRSLFGRSAFVGSRGEELSAESSEDQQARASGEQELLFLRRGLHPIGQAKALSLYPMGFFRRQISFRSVADVIVLPEIFLGLRTQTSRSPRGWRHVGDRVGQSEDLHGLRDFRSGDDPRAIHWKQSARNSKLIYQEHSEDEARRVSVVVDSLVPPAIADDDQRFERLVSEAATACVEYLDHGYEVELRLREGSIGFGSGAWHQQRVLEALALLQYRVALPEDRGAAPLVASAEPTAVLRFSLIAGSPTPEGDLTSETTSVGGRG